MTTRLLTGGVGADGASLVLRLDDVSGTVVAAAASLVVQPTDDVVDCTGLVLLPVGAEPHVHLDKVGTIGDAPNPSGELMDAVRAWLAHAPSLTFDDVHRRATEAIDRYVVSGTTAVRSHVNVHATIDLAVLEAVLAVRDDVADRCDVQVVALVTAPLVGDDDVVQATWAQAERALDLGADLVGGAPATDSDPVASVHALVDLAARRDLPIDLHVDEKLDPSSRSLLAYVDAVRARGLGGRATASHCVSLGQQDAAEQHATAVRLADAGIAVVALPPTNLWLQGRGRPVATPRGVTAVRTLLDAGVVVATGADNVEDPFCPLGRTDLVDAARLLALTAHLSPAEAWAAASTSSRAALGLAPADLTVGSRADVFAIEGADVGQALARASAHRLTFRAGRLVSRTTVTTAMT
ncbi:MAG: codA [Acidimicrobiales bacterium]|nr:codA [Acidimicrobiales bacterium]